MGSALAKSRSSVVGLAGFLTAPIAFHVARVLHKSTAQSLSVVASASPFPSILTLTIIKAIEYGTLGCLLGWLGKNPSAGLRLYALSGLSVGLLFGTIILLLSVYQSPTNIPLFSMVARAVNEIIFPMGCAIVLYCAHRFVASSSKT